MPFRFRRRIKLAPGVHLNWSSGGVSWSLGPRGASYTFGKRGVYRNLGIPGTGLYSRERISGPSSGGGSRSGGTVNLKATVTVEDDGMVTYKDADGTPLNEYLVKQLKAQNKDV